MTLLVVHSFINFINIFPRTRFVLLTARHCCTSREKGSILIQQRARNKINQLKIMCQQSFSDLIMFFGSVFSFSGPREAGSCGCHEDVSGGRSTRYGYHGRLEGHRHGHRKGRQYLWTRGGMYSIFTYVYTCMLHQFLFPTTTQIIFI